MAYFVMDLESPILVYVTSLIPRSFESARLELPSLFDYCLESNPITRCRIRAIFKIIAFYDMWVLLNSSGGVDLFRLGAFWVGRLCFLGRDLGVLPAFSNGNRDFFKWKEKVRHTVVRRLQCGILRCFFLYIIEALAKYGVTIGARLWKPRTQSAAWK